MNGTMDQKTFRRLCGIVYDQSGIKLGPTKEALVSSRVAKRMRALGLGTHGDYLDHLEQKDEKGEELVQLMDAISTNVTKFFREEKHFDVLAARCSEWLAAGQRRFRFWSAASSSGEEPYTMAMVLRECLGGSSADLRILATDISTRMLDACRRGEYTEENVAPVSPKLRNAYFDMRREEGRKIYRVKECLRRMILFKRLNLSRPPFPMQGPLDAVFCRNVMIYFDNRVRKALLTEVYRLLRPGGYLFVGHAESLTGLGINMKYVQPSVYVK